MTFMFNVKKQPKEAAEFLLEHAPSAPSWAFTLYFELLGKSVPCDRSIEISEEAKRSIEETLKLL